MLPPRAYVFIGLNIVRVLSIIALLLVFSSNIVTLVNDVKAVNAFMAAGKVASDSTSNSTLTEMLDADYILGSTVPNQPAGAFWAVLNRLFIIFQTIIMIASEFGFPEKFFNRFFPVLGKEFGLGALGLMQMLIGAAILSHRVDTFTLVSAFFLFSLGCLNCLLGLIFRADAKAKRSVTSWRDHAKASLPTHIGPINVQPAVNSVFNPSGPPSLVSNFYTGTSSGSHGSDEKSKMSSLGFGRQGEKAAALKGYLISKPIETLPRYAAKPESF